MIILVDEYPDSILPDGSLPGETWTTDPSGLPMIATQGSGQSFELLLFAGVALYGLAVGLAGCRKDEDSQ